MLAGEPVQRQAIPNPGQPDHLKKHRVQLKVGNRDLYGIDFRWMDESEIAKRETPAALYLVERSEYGPLIGTPAKIVEGGKEIGERSRRRARPAAGARREGRRATARAVKAIEKDEIGAVNYAARADPARPPAAATTA